MKWAFLLITLAGVIPLAGWLRRNRHEIQKVWVVVGFLVVQHGPLHAYMAIISWAGIWSGYTLGIEISLLDIIILAIYLSLPRGRFTLPFKFSIAFYFFSVLLSAFQANVPVATLFYAWQLVRVFFAYAVITKACEDSRVAPALLKGMAYGLILATFEAIWERFGLGILRTHGGFSHENFLGIVSHFIVYPFFALLLTGRRGWLPPLISLAGVIIAALTASRATLVVAGFGYFLLFVLSARQNWTPWKTKIALAAAVAVIVLAPLVVSSFANRFDTGAVSSFFTADDERIALARAAEMMLADHPMGVGANHFVVVANAQSYYTRVGLSWTSFGAYVHNLYWLVAAETGYIGIIAFLIFLLRPLFVAFACGFRNRDDQRGDILLGFGVALLLVYLHSFYEWVFVEFEIQYLFAATIGLIAGLAQQLGYWPRTHTTLRVERQTLDGQVSVHHH